MKLLELKHHNEFGKKSPENMSQGIIYIDCEKHDM